MPIDVKKIKMPPEKPTKKRGAAPFPLPKPKATAVDPKKIKGIK